MPVCLLGLWLYAVIVFPDVSLNSRIFIELNLRDAGYDAQIVKNESNNMFRVVASTFTDKLGAVNSRDQLRATYPDAWLLYNAQ